MTLRLALKEWKIVCEAISQGEQIVLARKGGIAEPEGEFELPKNRFWLYPTFFHEAAAKLNPQGTELLKQHPELGQAPTSDQVPLTIVCEVAAAVYLQQESQLQALASEQILNEEALAMRFHYRQPGLHALIVRAYVAASPASLTPTEAMSGCKSWVDLGEDVETDDLRPVLEDTKFEARKKILLSSLTP
ncbi:DUF1802 family protein [Blastopirellula marina]|uniref:DUF1802 domain-containing protein n=1 Tax=Blastopirellula marina TaxID=124 RepID=A0A2S8GD87_9BACT|nr:DUF1802 family protein [Blastopirellula marina]PQO42399.1 hypothetical protein C5Y93_29145 [Blastopirellula marina]